MVHTVSVAPALAMQRTGGTMRLHSAPNSLRCGQVVGPSFACSRSRRSLPALHALPEGPAPAGSDAVAARIAAAKRYKESSKAAPPPSPPTSTSTTTLPAAGTDATSSATTAPSLPKRQPVDYGAMAEFLQSPKGPKPSPAPVTQPLSPPSEPTTPPQAAGAAGISIRGIVTSPSPASAASTSAPSPTAAPAAAAASPQAPRGPELAPNPVPFLNREADPNLPASEVVRMIMTAPQTPGKGSAYEPAAALAGVLQDGGLGPDGEAALDPNMRMEEFTVLKEERMRRMGAEIITVDPSYNPGASYTPLPDIDAPSTSAPAVASSAAAASSSAQGASATASTQEPAPSAPAPLYQPKVSTWGAFPRPSNISEAFGGGRNITPGQELESKEQREAREAQYKAALKAYREKVGLDIDPELEVEAEGYYNEGMKFFDAGDIRASYDWFDKATQTVPLRTRIGGLATLQKAVVLDSMGYNEEAKGLYKKLKGHAVTSVARKAKQLVFGFEAATFLKADTISYAAKKSDYIRYFRSFADRNKIYIASEEDRKRDEELGRLSSVIAVMVLVAPLALFAWLALQQQLHL